MIFPGRAVPSPDDAVGHRHKRTGSSKSRVRNVATHVGGVLHEELSPVQPWIRSSSWLVGLLPSVAFIRLRTRLLIAIGWRICDDAAIFGVPRLYGNGNVQRRLTIGSRAMINVDCTIELNADVTIGDDAALGHEVIVLTSTHRLGRSGRRAGDLQALPVVIGDGAWVGARTVVLPGVTIGAGAVVMAGSVVNADVEAGSLVAGVPATVSVKRLPG